MFFIALFLAPAYVGLISFHSFFLSRRFFFAASERRLNPLPPCQSLQFVLSLFAHIFTSEIGRILKWLFCKMKRTTIENNWRWDQWLPCERFLKIGFSLWHGFLLLFLLLLLRLNTTHEVFGKQHEGVPSIPLAGGGFSISTARKIQIELQ